MPTAHQKLPTKISWEDFQRKYLEREDAFKYEWVNGQVEKTARTMDQKQLFICFRLLEFLFEIKSKHAISGSLISEPDLFFAGNHRRPDIAYLTEEQINLARLDVKVVAQFVIEVISKNDQMKKVNEKMEDYRAAGVPVIWHIFPDLKQVHVYRGKQMTICSGDDLCSAEPIIEGFVLPVSEIFK